MSERISDDESQVLSIRVSKSVREVIKTEAQKKGLTPSVFVRFLLYEKFGNEVAA